MELTEQLLAGDMLANGTAYVATDRIPTINGRWMCGAGFKTDKTDRELALLICNAQYTFQQHFFGAIAEEHYEKQQLAEATSTRHQSRTLLAYRRLPDTFTSDDVDREYGYQGSKGSICSRLKRLCDDGMAQKVRSGADNGKYRKLKP